MSAGTLNCSQHFSKDVFIFLYYFFFLHSYSIISTDLFSNVPILSYVSSNLLLSSSSGFLFLSLDFLITEFPFGLLKILYISLFIFSIWWSKVLTPSFNFLYIVFFCSLHALRMAALKSLPAKFHIWIPSKPLRIAGKWSESVSHSVVSDSLWSYGLYPTRLLCPWNSPGKITGVGCHFLLQGIFPTQGSNVGLPHCRQTPYQLSHQENQRIWVTFSYFFARLINFGWKLATLNVL